MPRRLLALAALALVGGLGAGCSEDVAPAARIGDRVVSTEKLLDEAEEWASSPTLLAQLQIGEPEGAGEGSYSTTFVDLVLTNRISFEVHRTQFEELGLELTDQERDEVRAGLFPDPAASEAVFEELSDGYGERLVSDLARQFSVSQAMAEDYEAWRVAALAGGEIEVNPRYGSMDAVTGQVVPPDGPRRPPGTAVLVEP